MTEILVFIIGVIFFAFATMAVAGAGLIYFITRRFKKTFMVTIGVFVISIITFVSGLTGFITMAGSAGGIASMQSGSFSRQRNNLTHGVWTVESNYSQGFIRRTPRFTLEHLDDIQITSQLSGGRMWLEFEQNQTRLHVDLTDGFNEVVNLSEYGFVEGAVRVTMRFEGAHAVSAMVNWGQ